MPSEVIGLIARRTSDAACWLRSSVGAGMTPVADNPVILPDRGLEEEKKPGESEPPRTLPPMRLVAPQGQQVVLYLRQ